MTNNSKQGLATTRDYVSNGRVLLEITLNNWERTALQTNMYQLRKALEEIAIGEERLNCAVGDEWRNYRKVLR